MGRDTVEDVGTLVPLVKWMVGQRARRGLPHGVEPDDLEQVAMEAALRAAPRWDPAGGASWKTFAYRRARGAVSDYLRGTRPEVPVDRIPELGVAHLDARLPDAVAKADAYAVLRHMTCRERVAYFLHHAAGLSKAETARRMRVTPGRLTQLLHGAERRVEELLPLVRGRGRVHR
jgi:RNA polymerase sigma factor (sigma-70 family)